MIKAQSASEAFHIVDQEIGYGARSLSMGGAFSAIGDGSSGMYWNPAGLSFHDTKEIYFNHANWIADISFDYFGLTLPLNPRSTLGFNITSVTMDEMEVTRYGNEDTGETFKAADYAIASTYAMDLTDRFSIGINGKFIQQSIANSHARGFAIDFGTLFTTPFGFNLGTSISNFGSKLKMTGDDLLVGVDVDENIDGNNESVTGILSTDYFDLPLVLRIGISDEVKLGLRNKLVLSLDAVSPNDNANYKDLNQFIPLVKDQKIVSINKPIVKDSGIDIFGNKIDFLPINAFFQVGNNIAISEDKLSLIANINGCLFIKSGVLHVDDVYQIRGDVDFHTGNIDFNGDVIIGGDVKSGFKIISKGNIYVNGTVESSDPVSYTHLTLPTNREV